VNIGKKCIRILFLGKMGISPKYSLIHIFTIVNKEKWKKRRGIYIFPLEMMGLPY